MAEKKAFLLRLDPAVWAELERLAQGELRSVNAQIEFLLRDALGRRGIKSNDAPQRVGLAWPQAGLNRSSSYSRGRRRFAISPSARRAISTKSASSRCTAKRCAITSPRPGAGTRTGSASSSREPT